MSPTAAPRPVAKKSAPAPTATPIAARTSRSKTSATTARSRRARTPIGSIRRSSRSTDRRWAIPGPPSSRTGTRVPSRALATATASGNRPGGSVLPFYARNFTNLRQWIAAVAPGDLMPTILSLQANDFSGAPPTDPANRTLKPQADRIQSHGTRSREGPHRRPRSRLGRGRTRPAHSARSRRTGRRRARRSSRSPTSDSRSRTARKTRWCS